MKRKPNSRETAFIALAVITAISLIFVIFQSLAKGENLCAVVSVDGERVAVIPFDAEADEREIDLEKHFGVKVVFIGNSACDTAYVGVTQYAAVVFTSLNLAKVILVCVAVGNVGNGNAHILGRSADGLAHKINLI